MASTEQQDASDLVKRGQYKSSPLGRAIFVGLRALDPLLQYTILTHHAGISWLPARFGGTLYTTVATTSSLTTTSPVLFGLPPYQSLILCMSIGSMLKQNFWVLAISPEEMPPSSAVFISLFNTVMNGLNTALATWTLSSMNPSVSTSTELLKSPYVLAGIMLYTTGLLTETISEIQRSAFKRDARNKGKPYAGGLFGLARNINYGGYTLWRTGFAMASAGPKWAAVVGAWFFYDFASRSIPLLDKYCSKKVSFALRSMESSVAKPTDY